jgi:exopolyphosphatase / guanosine-5'-triphosphate,3'-diphosphate pyrophosphatase
MRTAVVEVGTGSLRAVVVEPDAGGWFRVLADQRVVLGLQRAVRRDGALGEGLLQLAEETARRLRERCFREGADVTVVHVAAGLRDASDLAELRHRIGVAIGAEVAVMDTVGESRALLRAVRHRTAPPVPTVVVDLGEHELRIIGAPGVHTGPPEIVRLLSGTRDLLPTGAVDPYHPAVRGHLRARVAALLGELAPVPVRASWPTLTGRPGNAMARAITTRRWGLGGPDHDGARLSVAELASFERELAGISQTERLLLPSVDPIDADLVGLAIVLVQAVIERLGAEGVVVSRAQVHDGLVLAALGEVDDPAEDPRVQAVSAVAASSHGRSTARLAARLYEQLLAHGLLPGPRPDAGEADVDRRLLLDAAHLHDLAEEEGIGAAHRRGAAMLLEHGLRGYGPAELVEVASLVRFQRGRPPGQHFPPFARLPARRREALRRLTALLRLACALDRPHGGRVREVRTTRSGAVLEVMIEADADVELEVHAARGQGRYLEEVFGVELTIREPGEEGVVVAPVPTLEPLGLTFSGHARRPAMDGGNLPTEP